MDLRFASAFVLLSAACGGSSAGPPPNSTGSSTASTSDGGVAAGDAGKADERPFAGSLQEATSLISSALDKRQSEIATCVRDFRKRRTMKLEKISVSFGIDQEGKLLGVTSKGKEDAELKACIQDSLSTVVFPRSHAGVISITKTYEELVQ